MVVRIPLGEQGLLGKAAGDRGRVILPLLDPGEHDSPNLFYLNLGKGGVGCAIHQDLNGFIEGLWGAPSG